MILSYNALKKDGTTFASKGDFEGIGDLMENLSSQEMTLIRYSEQRYQIIETIKTLTQPGS